MHDLISRRSAIDKAELLFKDLRKDEVDMMGIGYNHAVSDNIAILKNLPAAEPGWIPVSERLPEDVEIGEEYPTVIFCTKGKTYIGFCEYGIFGYEKRNKWWNCDGDEYEVFDVVAWMPLPEPWKGEWT